MHGKIKLLDKNTINKIAAGEVIERPASVVKELVENSIDANSTRIIIDLEQSGKKLIRITDNGDGIGYGELKIAFEKHSTSKITKIDDVYSLSSMGFRGEALASVAAVARVECRSSDGKAVTGQKIIIDGGVVKSEQEVGCPKGTTIKIKDLFYNVPVRQKYLKSDQTELAHIIDVITHLAIYYHNITFKLIHNENELLNLPATKNRIDNLVNIYGKELVRNLVPIKYGPLPMSEHPNQTNQTDQADQNMSTKQNYTSLNLSITGYLGKPSVTRNDTSYQSIYVNGRYIENRTINNAIKEGYRTLVMKHRFPVIILFISIKPESVDVNIHPTKLQVRFEDEEAIYNTMVKTIKNTLQHHDLITEAKITPKPHTVSLKAITTLGIGKPGHYTTRPHPSEAPSVKSSHNNGQRRNEESINYNLRQRVLNIDQSEYLSVQQQQQLNQLQLGRQQSPHLKHLKQPKQPIQHSPHGFIQPIGQISDTYIIAQSDDGMLIIDQHAAHERIMYERIKKRYSASTMATQTLLEPVALELSLKEQELLKNNLKMLRELSFTIDELGQNSYYVKSIPIILGRMQEPELIHDIINDLISITKEKESDIIKDKMIQVMACKSAIKAGRPMNIPEIQQLLSELYTLNNPYTCAHGRPTIISMNEIQLKKLFKRIV
jgi:DNA mismatch repair protein MutL